MDIRGFIESSGTPIEIIRNPIVSSKAIISRLNRGTDDNILAYRRRAKFLVQDSIIGGDLIRDVQQNIHYLVLSCQKQELRGEIVGIYAHLGACNAEISIDYSSDSIDENGIPTTQWVNRANGVKAHQTFISARMRQEDPGLLATTVCTFHIQASVPIELLDRITIVNGGQYRVDAIDKISLSGIQIIQVSTYRA